MTLEEQCKLSYYKEIADISTHKNVRLVQHLESRRIYVKKEQKIYNKQIYEYLMHCNNPHIPKIYECIETEPGNLVIIEEYIQGEPLNERLVQGGVYAKEEVCQIVITICDVLEQLHQLPIPVIHRDLKPENILIQEHGYLKIIDFNTAKQFEKDRNQDTVLIGTREYAAPEQYGFAQSDVRTDIYALGVMMNYLLTRTYPRDFIYMAGCAQGEPMTQIIQRCTAFDPEQRYQSVMELRRDLQMVLGGKVDEVEGNGQYKQSDRLPPGFRTKTIWKMMVGTMGYLMIFWCGLTSEFTDNDGIALTGFELWANRLTMLMWMLLTVALCTDYMGMRKQFPMPKGRHGIIVGCTLWSFVFLIMLVIALGIIAP